MRLSDTADRKWLLRTVGVAVLAVAVVYVTMWAVGRALVPTRELAKSVDCRRNIHMLARASNLYADDYESHYMPTQDWELALEPYVEPRYRRCPSVADRPGDTWGYGMNRHAAEASRDLIDRLETTPLVFDSRVLKHNAVGELSDLPKPGRHLTRTGKDGTLAQGNWIGYADGSARFELDGARSAALNEPPRGKDR